MKTTLAATLPVLVSTLFAFVPCGAEPAADEPVPPVPEIEVKEESPSEPSAENAGGPALTLEEDLADFESLDTPRRHLVLAALKISRDHPGARYIHGSADPANGGFDCSGAVRHILKQVDIEAPRSSAAQYDWVRRSGRFTAVDDKVTSVASPAFAMLRPGDLLFWGESTGPEGHREFRITHVQMYLGREKKDGLPVMIGSSNGRSYRGKRQSGYGIVDFRLPNPSSTVRFVGFGPPPGLPR